MSFRCGICGGELKRGKFYEPTLPKGRRFLPYECLKCYRRLDYGEIIYE